MFGVIAKEMTRDLVEPTEGIGDTLAPLTWMLFGVAIVGQVFEQITWQVFVLALLSLTVVRVLPVYLSLTGSGESSANKLFLGWFGPRASPALVFTVIVLEKGLPGAELMAQVVICTVFMSLILHGVSANPLARQFSK